MSKRHQKNLQVQIFTAEIGLCIFVLYHILISKVSESNQLALNVNVKSNIEIGLDWRVANAYKLQTIT